MPHGFIGPIIILRRPIYDWIESGGDLFAVQNVLGFLVLLVADAVGVGAGGCYQEVQRLGASVPTVFIHHVEERPVGLSVQVVEHDTGNVEAMLRIRLSRKHLIKTVGGFVDDALLGA